MIETFSKSLSSSFNWSETEESRIVFTGLLFGVLFWTLDTETVGNKISQLITQGSLVKILNWESELGIYFHVSEDEIHMIMS